MNLKNQKPVLVPFAHWAELDGLSKAALMDVVWSFATRCAGREDDAATILAEVRREAAPGLAARTHAAR